MDIKQLYRSIYLLVKQLDEQKTTITTVADIFSSDIERLRGELIEQSETLIFLNHDSIGKKAREIFWRKGFYDVISMAKRQWTKSIETKIAEEKMAQFILDAIWKFKAIVVRLEDDYEMNLRYIIDFSLLDIAPESWTHNKHNHSDEDIEPLKFPYETINYAFETIHAMLLSIGDLHRYFIEFKFSTSTITRDYAAKYYYEAFKLNPVIGMAQNQLGTLYSGLNYDLDSMYYYLYSLICPQPFDLSENNVLKIFQKNSEYLETLENDKLENNLKDFMAQFILIVDIFFYDKEVTDFNMLCHCTLVGMRELLKSKRVKLPDGFWFKIVATLFFCMAKLKGGSSSKKYSLNAFLVAVCSELVDSCIANLETFIEDHSIENGKFQDNYNYLFEKFDEEVRQSREKYRMLNSKTKDESTHLNGVKKEELKSQVSEVSYAKSTTTESQNSANDKDIPIIPNETNAQSISSQPNITTNASAKKLGNKLRRRRKRISSYESNSDLSSRGESDIEMDSDFSSDDISCDSSYSSSEDFEDDDIGDNVNYLNMNGDEKHLDGASSPATVLKTLNGYPNFSDNDDFVIEEEKIVYSSNNDEKNVTENNNICTYFLDPTAELIKNLTNIELTSLDFCFTDDDKDLIIEEETIVYTQRNNEILSGTSPIVADPAEPFDANIIENGQVESSNGSTDQASGPEAHEMVKQEKLRYKRKYSKVDPNIIIEFAMQENTLMALKIMFDWLKINNDILTNCFTTNPEFVHKIMKLLNHFNIDIFTNKVYFERNMLATENVRDDLRSLFDVIGTVPMHEDVLLKKFSELKSVQQHLDWEISLKSGISCGEENILRIFKLVDFGFFICKMKKFKYNFCARSRRFAEMLNKKERTKGKRRDNQKRREKRRNYMRRKFEIGGDHRKRPVERSCNNDNTSNDDNEPNKSDKSLPKKSYLKNRNLLMMESKQQTLEKEVNGVSENKYELMGKLWLRNEVKTLESKIKRPTLLTPYLVMDSKSLTEYTSIVKNLIKTKKFIVLIPNAVFSELDELKKTSERARNAIRWLEKEFSKGSRFLRPQRKQESLPMALLKLPKKLDREALTFLKIAEFCNYIQKHHGNDDDYTTGSEQSTNVLTLLTGDQLISRKSIGFSYTGIMHAMSINFEQITAFYAKYKKK